MVGQSIQPMCVGRDHAGRAFHLGAHGEQVVGDGDRAVPDRRGRLLGHPPESRRPPLGGCARLRRHVSVTIVNSGFAEWTGATLSEPPPPPVPGAYQQGFSPAPDDPLISPDFNGWWNRAMRLLSANWRPLVVIQLLWAIPLLIVAIIANVVPSENIRADSPGDLTALLLIALPFTALAFLLGLVATLATLHLLVQYVTG